ncbi:MAG: hypothetical protein WCY34_04045, partial [Candidatus Omnitrophota bacterium]
EYDLGEEASSGGITPMYLTTTTDNLTVNNNNGKTSSTRSAIVAEVMTYKIGERRYPQGRVSGDARSLSGSD